MIELYTSYYAKINNKNTDDILLISVSNTIPSWLNKSVCSLPFKISPSWNIINKFKNREISYEYFNNIYTAELNNSLIKKDVIKYINNLANEEGYTKVVLLCYEKKECHRFALVDWLEHSNYIGEL